ncbi:MAG: glycosyltransferase family 4 protein [Planctomycetaceae bacterium]
MPILPSPCAAGRLPRVVVDLERTKHANCGLGRFCSHLADALVRAGRGAIDPVFLAHPRADRGGIVAAVEHLEVRPWRKEAFARYVRPLARPFRRRSRYDLWHVTSQTSKYLPFDPRVPVVLTIHDLNFLHDDRHRERPRTRRRKLAAVQAKVDRAAAVVTISRFVADDVEAHLDLGGRPLHVVFPGVPAPPPASPRPPAFLPPGPFYLAVGVALPHKNCHALLPLVERMPGMRLVIAGRCATPYGEWLRREIDARRLGGRVLLPGEITDGDRQWLYQHCQAVFVPSLAEGFGLPVIEAMQLGKAVFLARRTSLPEVAGDEGFYWHSFDPDHMLDVLRRGLEDAARVPDHARRLRDRAARFSWERAAGDYLRIYGDTLAKTAA